MNIICGAWLLPWGKMFVNDWPIWTIELLLRYAGVQGGAAVWQICLIRWHHVKMAFLQLFISVRITFARMLISVTFICKCYAVRPSALAQTTTRHLMLESTPIKCAFEWFFSSSARLRATPFATSDRANLQRAADSENLENLTNFPSFGWFVQQLLDYVADGFCLNNTCENDFF